MADPTPPPVTAPDLMRPNTPPAEIPRIERPTGPGNPFDDAAQEIVRRARQGAKRGDEPKPEPASPMPAPFKTARR